MKVQSISKVPRRLYIVFTKLVKAMCRGEKEGKQGIWSPSKKSLQLFKGSEATCIPRPGEADARVCHPSVVASHKKRTLTITSLSSGLRPALCVGTIAAQAVQLKFSSLFIGLCFKIAERIRIWKCFVRSRRVQSIYETTHEYCHIAAKLRQTAMRMSRVIFVGHVVPVRQQKERKFPSNDNKVYGRIHF